MTTADRLEHYKHNDPKFASRPIPKATPIILDDATDYNLYIVEKIKKKRTFNRQLEF
ncbi:hypothetical protein H310_14566 [Aphanomyces invadans]|uniref:Uncharacterized protein n=1 Tax=Aphanomyces invadans TaxID=157072 RepID=A0A024TBD3_9STRA|nr:hypothetical protein H310_14566 [Aphanomyces invadans]ETV90672.1 hypothetical protein H310_14566 [Aphanomyces invadans]|eukprot:XP_008880669.1 hypothetical protein H310_14566 [Aphanomyces invadans]